MNSTDFLKQLLSSPSHVIMKVFLCVNYTDDLMSLRLVSRSWTHFIDLEILRKTNIKKQLRNKAFVHAWTLNRPQLRSLCEHLDASKGFVTLYGDHIFDYHFDMKKIFIYKNSELITCASYRPFYFSPLLPCGDFFVCLEQAGTAGGFRLIIYKLAVITPDDADQTGLKKPGQGREFLLAQLVGRDILWLEMLECGKVILICMDSARGSIVVINLESGDEKIIRASRIGNSSTDLRIGSSWARHLVDNQHLVIFWGKENFLQFFDIERCQEVWTKECILNPECFRVRLCGMTRRYLCMEEAYGYERRYSQFNFFEAKTGQLINCFSNRINSIYPAMVTANRFIWLTLSSIFMLNAEEGSVTEVVLFPCVESNMCSISKARMLSTVQNRLLLLRLECECTYNGALAVVDVLEKTLSLVQTEQENLNYGKNVLRDEVFYVNKEKNEYEVLSFK